MKRSMVLAAQRDGEFVAHLTSEGSWLGKPEMMGIGGFSTADDAGLCGHELAMPLVTEAMRLGYDRDVCGREVWPRNGGRAYLLCFRPCAGRVSGSRSDD